MPDLGEPSGIQFAHCHLDLGSRSTLLDVSSDRWDVPKVDAPKREDRQSSDRQPRGRLDQGSDVR